MSTIRSTQRVGNQPSQVRVYSHLAKPRQQLIAPHTCGNWRASPAHATVLVICAAVSRTTAGVSCSVLPCSDPVCRRSFSDSITLLAAAGCQSGGAVLPPNTAESSTAGPAHTA
eukprot:scaffold13730_cov63-Phaeocystis_antarctica.AAC.1